MFRTLGRMLGGIDPSRQALRGGRHVPFRPNIDTGGNLNLGPETAKEFSLGMVVQPSRHFSASVD